MDIPNFFSMNRVISSGFGMGMGDLAATPTWGGLSWPDKPDTIASSLVGSLFKVGSFDTKVLLDRTLRC